MWGVVQSLPASIADPSFEPLRPLATLAFVFNAAWLVIFAHQLFWTALVVIVMYLWTVYALVALIRVNTVKALANITQPGVWRMLIGQHCFSANAAWLTAATLLQFEINLLEVRPPLRCSADSFDCQHMPFKCVYLTAPSYSPALLSAGRLVPND